MTDSYNVGYSVDALGDLREIYSFIGFHASSLSPIWKCIFRFR